LRMGASTSTSTCTSRLIIIIIIIIIKACHSEEPTSTHVPKEARGMGNSQRAVKGL
jgi:hypothetical protein